MSRNKIIALILGAVVLLFLLSYCTYQALPENPPEETTPIEQPEETTPEETQPENTEPEQEVTTPVDPEITTPAEPTPPPELPKTGGQKIS